MSSLPFQYTLTVGDHGDGHNQSVDYVFKTSHSKDEINEAYHKAEKLAGYGLTSKAKNQILEDYGDRRIPKKAVKNLEKIGVSFDPDSDGGPEPNGAFICYSDDVFHLYMGMAQTQLRDLAYMQIKPEKLTTHMIGYGVFD